MKVSVGATQELWDFTPNEYNEIFEQLTMLNPAYQQAVMHSPYPVTNIPKYLFFANGNQSLLSVPRGYKIPYNYVVSKDERFTLENINYPTVKITPRKTQQEAMDAYLKAREENPNNIPGIFEIPTGKGKSVLGALLAAKLKQRALVIVNKDDLVDTWMDDIYLALGIKPRLTGLIKAKHFRLGKRITITTIQTLAKLPKEKLDILRSYFSMIIVDEFHHSAARIYEVVNTFPAKDRIGLTATAMRNDKLDPVLNFYFGDICYRFEESDDDEDIIPPKQVHVIVKNSDIKYYPPDMYYWTDGKHHGLVGNLQFKRDGETVIAQSNSSIWMNMISDLMEKGQVKRKPLSTHKMYDAIDQDIKFNRMIARDIFYEYKQGKSCIVFCKEKDHVRLLEKLSLAEGVPQEQIQLYYGDTKGKDAKKEMRAKAESKEVLITIATYSIATEGTNVKSWEVGFLAMTFNNPISAIQAIGRTRRQKKGKKIVKIYDYRHPNIRGARNHGITRDKVYEEKGFTIIDQTKGNSQPQITSRGFGKSF